MSPFSKSPISKQWGFTLAEMVVCLAVIGIIATIFLGNRRQYSDQLTLRAEAYNLILAIREAQIESLGVRGYTEGGITTFNISYGVHFDSSNMDRFYYFADENDNGRFDAASEWNTVAVFNGGTIVDQVCGTGPSACYTGPTGNFRQMSITFKRPDSAARIRFMNNGGEDTAPSIVAPATIRLVSLSGRVVTVMVEASGQISIQ